MDDAHDAAAEELLDGDEELRLLDRETSSSTTDLFTSMPRPLHRAPDPEDRPMSAAEVAFGIEVAAYLLLCRAPS